MFEIGNTLREARLRRGLNVAECEVGTKIRAKYLRAIEDEHFELLPSSAYVRGFLTTYAEYLGLDGRLFMDEYESRFGEGSEMERRLARNQRARQRRKVVNRRKRRFGADGKLAWLGAGGVVAFVVVMMWGMGGEDPTPAGNPFTPTVPVAAADPAALATSEEAPETLKITLRGTGDYGSAVEVRDGKQSGEPTWNGTIPTGAEKAWSTAKPLYVRAYNAEGLVVKVGKKSHKLRGGVVDVVVDHRGVREAE